MPDGGVTDTGTVSITINPVNDNDPVAVNDSITVDEGATATTLDGGAISVLANDTDVDLPNDSLSVTLDTDVTYGSLTLNADGTFSYTHDGSENFSDSFTYIISDADGGTTSTGMVTIAINPVNDNDPVAVDDSITVDEGGTVTTLDGGATSVLANDTDTDLPNDSLSVSLDTDVTYGTLTLNADGTFSYTHDGSENFADSFTYIVSDADGGTTSTGTVSIAINPINDGDPVAVDDSITVDEGGTATTLDGGATSVLNNDLDADLPGDTLTATLDTDATYGTLTLNADGTFSYTHDGSENFTDSFTYIVSDANGGVTDTGTVTIAINPVNDNDPVAVNDSITVDEGATATTLDGGATSVLANDTDTDLPNDSLSVSLDTDVAHGTLTLNADGTFSYTHDGSENFSDSSNTWYCTTLTPIVLLPSSSKKVLLSKVLFAGDTSIDSQSHPNNLSTASSTVNERDAVGVAGGVEEETINTKLAMKELSMMFSSPAMGLNDLEPHVEDDEVEGTRRHFSIVG